MLKLVAKMCCLFFLMLPLVSCSIRPLGEGSAARYDLSDPTYKQHGQVLERGIRAYSQFDTWVSLNHSESQEISIALANIRKLIREKQHIPSVYLLGKYLISKYVYYVRTGGFNGKFAEYYERDLAIHDLSRADYNLLKAEEALAGYRLLEIAAREDYAPAVEVLKSIKLVAIPQKSVGQPKRALVLPGTKI